MMAQELPWFRFSPQEWQNGNITLESYDVQGLFINVCAYYWIKDCSITLAMLKRRFSNANGLINELLKSSIFTHDEITDEVRINFLDEQFSELLNTRKARQEAGKKGGLSNAKAGLNPDLSYKIRRDKIREDKKIKDKTDNKIESAKKIEQTFSHYEKLYNETEDVRLKETIQMMYHAIRDESLYRIACMNEHPKLTDVQEWLKVHRAKEIVQVMRAMENYDINKLKKYKSFRLTLNNWLKKEAR